MISADYVIMMARYNAWQNKQLRDILGAMPEAEVLQDRGGFFGSILQTANHILWADLLWTARLAGGDLPTQNVSQSVDLTANVSSWAAERFRTDGRILHWAQHIRSLDLAGDLTWFSSVLGREMSKPKGIAIAHFFNHQTHHRGQIHAMITAAGATAPVSDLLLMPETGPWT